MVETTQSPLAMLVLVTPYTILYVVNQLFLHSNLDQIHYLFFELIFVLAFRKIFGLPDLTERFFPTHRFPHLRAPIHVRFAEGLQPVKTSLAGPLIPPGSDPSIVPESTTNATTIAAPPPLPPTTTTTTTTSSICTYSAEGLDFMPTMTGAAGASGAAVMRSAQIKAVKTTTPTSCHESVDVTLSELAIPTLTAATTTPTARATTATPALTPTRTIALLPTSSSSPPHQPKPSGPYAAQLERMEKKFMEYVDNTEIWEKVYEDTSVRIPSFNSNNSNNVKHDGGCGWIQVFQFKSRPMCYKIIAYMNNTAAVTFDMLCDLDRRSQWDPMCVEAKVLEHVSEPAGTTIQYVRTKAVWPTASRDTVVLGTVKELKEKHHDDNNVIAHGEISRHNNDSREGALFMVNASIEHSNMPERVKEKIVRMETSVAGHIITPVEGSPAGRAMCKLVQILDADLKGWIPDKVIQMVSTKAVPDGLRAINKIIPTIEPYQQSKVLARAAEAQRETDALWRKVTDVIADSTPTPSENALVEAVLDADSGHVAQDKDENVELELNDSQLCARPSFDQDDVIRNSASSISSNDDIMEIIEKRDSAQAQRQQRSSSETERALSSLHDRLRAVEAEMEVDRRERAMMQMRHAVFAEKESLMNDGDRDKKNRLAGTSRKQDKPSSTPPPPPPTTAASMSTRTMEKVKPAGSTFNVFWEEIKENLGFGLTGTANKVLVGVIVAAVLGAGVAKLHRR
ncbi:hypothetical protein EDD11_009901 [Mortierella claussenii]|nr:hypothetical protein EDD11_009901 [Mortierella claussenii]